MYALADCNNFFVSCERVFRPDLEGKPVVVLSGNDGCVIARSNEVKALGVKMGAPLFKIRDLVKQHNIVCFSSNFELYGDLSSRVMRILSHYSDRCEQYSIDEAFLYFDDNRSPANLQKLARQIVVEIRRGIGIPVSIGLAPTRTLAKVASKYAKKYAGYKGACLIDTDDKRIKALSQFEISDVWGIGRRYSTRLQKASIRTALDFANQSSEFARNLMHLPGLRTWQELNGFDAVKVDELARHLTITRSRTFARHVTDLPTLESYIADFCSSCARKLRQQKSVCAGMLVFALPSRFETILPSSGVLVDEQKATLTSGGGIFAEVRLPVPTDLTAELLEYALAALRARFVGGYPYKKAGVILQNILPANSQIERLFDERDRQKEQRLQKVVDSLNEKRGKNTVILASQVKTEQMKDKLQSRMLSPCYSTRWSDLITVKC